MIKMYSMRDTIQQLLPARDTIACGLALQEQGGNNFYDFSHKYLKTGFHMSAKTERYLQW